MNLILGNGYVGCHVQNSFYNKRISFLDGKDVETDYLSHTKYGLVKILKKYNITRVFNCVGYVGKPNVDACLNDKQLCKNLNVHFVGKLVDACYECDIEFVHVSSGCIYKGDNNGNGYSEVDLPNFADSFYSYTKIRAEELCNEYPKGYICRLRMPFGTDPTCQRNYLYKLNKYQNILEADNSITNIHEFADAMAQIALGGVPYGTYNMCNHGSIRASQILKLMGIKKKLVNEEDFRTITLEPRSSCVLNTEKIKKHNIEFSGVLRSVASCIGNAFY
jgi:dTDP-4-dehydrorhamnose reductase